MKRNESNGTFAAHLFPDADVTDAAPDDRRRGTTDDPVESLCGRTRSYGPFEDADFSEADREAGGTVCAVCVQSWAKRRREDGSRTRDPEGSAPENGGPE